MLHKVQHLSLGTARGGLNVAVYATFRPAGAKRREKCCRKYNISPLGRGERVDAGQRGPGGPGACRSALRAGLGAACPAAGARPPLGCAPPAPPVPPVPPAPPRAPAAQPARAQPGRSRRPMLSQARAMLRGPSASSCGRAAAPGAMPKIASIPSA